MDSQSSARRNKIVTRERVFTSMVMVRKLKGLDITDDLRDTGKKTFFTVWVKASNHLGPPDKNPWGPFIKDVRTGGGEGGT